MVKNVSSLHSSNTLDDMQQVVYGISHDMGAPLRAVVQFTQLLEERLDSRLDDKERHWIQLILQSGAKAQAMIDGLLRYSRLGNNAPVTRFSLNSIVQSVIYDQLHNDQLYNEQRVIKSALEQASFEISPQLPHIEGIIEHWHLFFINIIDNALRYQPQLDHKHIPQIHIHCDYKDGEHYIQIDDNGIGVSEKQRHELTRPFMRAQRDQDYPGIGMGLSYCERIAQLHGGRLHFDTSTLGGLSVIYSYPEVIVDG